MPLNRNTKLNSET